MAASNRIIELAVLVVAVLSSLSLLAEGQIVNGSQIEGIRLVDRDGTIGGNEGRVEIMYNGTWGTICDGYYGWYTSDAQVACRMLGFEDALCAAQNSYFGHGSYSSPIWMSDVYCNGYESALDLCYFSGWGEHSYYYSCTSHYYDVGVVCLDESITKDVGIPSDIRLIKSSTTSITIGWTAPAAPSWATYGRFTIRYQSDQRGYAQTRTYYNSSFINVTHVEMSYTLTSLTRDTQYSIEIRAEVQNSACYYYHYTYGNYSDPVLFRTNATLRRSKIPVRLVSPSPGLHFLGRVEVFHDNQWGTVCDNNFYTAEANVICQMLNFTQGAVCSVSYAQFGQGHGPIWLDNVECQPGDEILEDCDHNSWGNTSCSHYEDVGVICRPNTGDIRSAVQNLTVLSVSATSITVGWSQYTFPPGAYYTGYELRYIDSYGYIQTASTSSYYSRSSDTQYTLSWLRFEEEYEISVRAFFEFSGSCYSYIYSPYSNNVTATTMETAPTGAPQDFYVAAINRTAIQADWDLPPVGYRGGFILGYKLFIQSTNGGAERTIDITDNSTAYIVGGLQPATAYRLSVLAYTSVGDGPRSIRLTVSTLRFDPLITQFGYYGNGQDRITRYSYDYYYYYNYYGRVHIHCASSNVTFAPPHWFFANGSRIGVRDRNFQAGHFPNETAVLKIADYRPLSYCDGGVFICRVNNSVSGHSQEKKFTLTINYSPPSPGQPFLIKAQSTSLTIGWSEAVCDGGHAVNNFNIRFSRSSSYSSSSSYTYIRDIDPVRRNYTITGLQANTYYSFSIQAVNLRAQSSSYSSSFSATTLPPAPSAPRDVTARLVAPLKVEVRWRSPAVTNGDISHYNVYAIPLRSTVSNNTHQTLQMAFPGRARAGNITLVIHSITYQFRVSAAVNFDQTYNEGDLSPIGVNTSLFVPKPGLPTPTNPHITNSTNSSITLMWNYPPPPSEAVEKFFVTYSGEIEWISPEDVYVRFEDRGETNTSINSVKISALVPGTTYTFKVSAITQSGRGAEVMLTGTTDNNVSLAYFQLRMGPVRSCFDFMDFAGSNTDDLDVVRDGLVKEFSHLCPRCGVTAANIKDDEFSCRGGLARKIVYRARMVGTDTYSAEGLVSLLQTWVESDVASVMVQSTRFHLDPTCYTKLDSLFAIDCIKDQAVTTLPPYTKPITTSESTPTVNSESTPSVNSESTPSVDSESTPSVKPVPVNGSVSAGEIGGIAVGVVIVLLLIILIVVVICKKWRPKVIRRYGRRGLTHVPNDDDMADDIPFVVDGGDEDNNPTLSFDDDDKDDQTTMQ